MSLVDLIRRSAPQGEIQRYVLPPWMQHLVALGTDYMPTYQTTYGTDTAEPIGNNFADYILNGLQGNGVVFAVERFRVSVFSEARFGFRSADDRPGKLTRGPDLRILDRPWVGGTTGDLLARMLLDADFAGNSFNALIDEEMVRLRPDWTDIVFAPRMAPYGRHSATVQVGHRKLGYMYFEGGNRGSDPAMFLAEDVCHYAPMPDPLAMWRGMSWLTPVVREIQADAQATKHKLKFFENAATPNLAVSLPKEIKSQQFKEFIELMESKHAGAENAYKTLYTGGGADVTVVGADMRQLDFKVTQGAGETRIASAAGIHPVVAALSEGMQGSSLNAGNFGSARRLVADGTLRPLWRNAAGSLEVLVPPPDGDELWYDESGVGFLREDAADAAAILKEQMLTIESGVRAGFKPDTVTTAVTTGDLSVLEHSGLYSVQLIPPDKMLGGPPATTPSEVPA